MKHKQAWTVVAVLFLVGLGSIFLGGWQINNGGGGSTFTGGAITSPITAANGTVGAPSYSFTSFPSYGGYFNGGFGMAIAANGADSIGFGASAVRVPSGLAVAWNSASSLGAGALDAGISRDAAGAVLDFGNSSVQDETALLRWNTCKVTADITLPVNTATTVCTWSLPARAHAWGWQCQIPWAITAGTGTNTLAIIANASQTPTAATNGSAEIKTTNANVATEATTAISASGATTLLTSPTITPNAATFMSSTSGTVLASGTAGTFAIQMTAAGTTATAAAKAGATCELY